MYNRSEIEKMVLQFSLSALLLAATCLAHISQRNVVDRAAIVINENLSTVGVPIDQISRQIRAANPVASEYRLYDTNPRGLMHYSGNDSKVRSTQDVAVYVHR